MQFSSGIYLDFKIRILEQAPRFLN